MCNYLRFKALAPVTSLSVASCRLYREAEGRREEGTALCLGELWVTGAAPGLRPWGAWPIECQVCRGKEVENQ